MSVNSLAVTLHEHVNSRPIADPPVFVKLPPTDDQETDGESIGHAEGQSFLIEYVDSKGQPSLRRITVWNIISGYGGIPCLLAFCYERNARRQFRIDRIKSCIDFDGQVYADVPAFLVENFGMSTSMASASAADGDRWHEVLGNIRTEATILSSIIRADGRLRLGEVDAVVEYLWRRAEATGIQLSPREVIALQRYVNRLRPTEDAIFRALDKLSHGSPSSINRLLSAAVVAMDSDGSRHNAEIALVNAIAKDLIGMPIVL